VTAAAAEEMLGETLGVGVGVVVALDLLPQAASTKGSATSPTANTARPVHVRFETLMNSPPPDDVRYCGP
jgi:hypothetical protein